MNACRHIPANRGSASKQAQARCRRGFQAGADRQRGCRQTPRGSRVKLQSRDRTAWTKAGPDATRDAPGRAGVSILQGLAAGTMICPAGFCASSSRIARPPDERCTPLAWSVTADATERQPGFRSHSGSKPHNEPEGAVEVAARALPDDPQAQAARQIAHKALMRSPGDGGPRQMPTRDLKRHDFPPAPRRATPPARGSAKEAWRSTGARLGNLRAVTARPWAIAPYWPS